MLTGYSYCVAASDALRKILEAEPPENRAANGRAAIRESGGISVSTAIAELGGVEQIEGLPDCLVGRVCSLAKWHGKSGFLSGNKPALVFLATRKGPQPLLLKLNAAGMIDADIATDGAELPPESLVISGAGCKYL